MYCVEFPLVTHSFLPKGTNADSMVESRVYGCSWFLLARLLPIVTVITNFWSFYDRHTQYIGVVG